MKTLLYTITFFTITPITILVSLFALTVTTTHINTSLAQNSITTASTIPTQLYAALPGQLGKVAGIATGEDARIEIIRQYLEKYSSPLLPHASDLVSLADKYELDFRLLVAIAQQESNLCKKIPQSSYNCWGWGVHSRGTLGFTSYVEGAEEVAKGLREDYFDKGYKTPEQIMAKYTPLSPGTWARGVQQFLEEME